MSGYKNTGMSQEHYQAMIAYAGYHGLHPHSPAVSDAWDEMDDAERERWIAAAAEVRHDTRTEPILNAPF
jgi:hypothetical protein